MLALDLTGTVISREGLFLCLLGRTNEPSFFLLSLNTSSLFPVLLD